MYQDLKKISFFYLLFPNLKNVNMGNAICTFSWEYREFRIHDC